jgi:hypothetical protein
MGAMQQFQLPPLPDYERLYQLLMPTVAPQVQQDPVEAQLMGMLTAARRPRLRPVVPVNVHGASITPQDIQGMAQMNIAENESVLAQQRQAEESALMRQRLGLEQARLAREQAEPTPQQTAMFNLASQLMGAEYGAQVDYAKAMALEGARSQNQIAEITARAKANEAKDQAMIGYYNALAGAAGRRGGEGEEGLWNLSPADYARAIELGYVSPEQGTRAWQQHGAIAPPSWPDRLKAFFGLAPKSLAEQKVQLEVQKLAAQVKTAQAKNAPQQGLTIDQRLDLLKAMAAAGQVTPAQAQATYAEILRAASGPTSPNGRVSTEDEKVIDFDALRKRKQGQ